MNDKRLITYPIYEDGFRAKTINVRTNAGGNKFLLQQINELGLPLDAIILGVWCRTSSDSIKSSNGQLLVSSALQQTAYISLKDRANKNNNINLLLSDYYMNNLVDSAFLMQPVPSVLIDWNQSYIEISGTTPAVNARVFEIVVLYTDRTKVGYPIKPMFCFRNNETLAGIRTTSFEINLNSSQSMYSFGNTSNVGLEQDAIVLGIRFLQNPYPLSGKTVLDTTSFNSCYISLKKGIDSVLDNYPAALTAYTKIFPDINYFPVRPFFVQEFDWQNSEIRFQDITNLTDAMVFQYELIWISTKI